MLRKVGTGTTYGGLLSFEIVWMFGL